ncbi:ABC transporter substrate-binding protein [Saccharomonospora sp. NPDC046836]|uniref:ABC transporter substrate-binding protein n=1 Tax=Saccharomonospora sp. NPDC046836 TaxID=3156921 RepID=UPI0033EFD413
MENWVDDVNRNGGLIGREVQLIYYDDQTDASSVPGIYTQLMDVDKVDIVLGGYGTNTLAPAMPLIVDRQRYFVGLMGLGVNATLKYSGYFVMIPTGPRPNSALTEGFFELASRQSPRPRTVAFVSADAEFARNPILGATENAEIESIITAHLDVWNGPAGTDRDESIAELYASDVFVGEPEAAYKGHAGMSEAIAALQTQLPGTVISRSGPVQMAQDLVTYSWTLGVDGQVPIASGRDVLVLREGKIASLYVLIDAA